MSNPPSAWVGIIGLSLLLLTTGLIAWYLLLSPLAEPAPRLPDTPANRKRTGRLVLAYMGAQLFMSIGSFWDLAWHMRFGIFVADFWWPPHLMLYAGFFASAVVAGIALGQILRGKGSLRARFRLAPLMGALFLVAAAKLVYAPLDEVWHQIYGADISGLSAPHLFLAIAGGLELFLVVTMGVHAVADRFWRSLTGWVIIINLGFSLWGWLIITVGDFEYTGWNGQLPPGHPAFDRPAWAYAVIALLPATAILTAAVRLIGGRWTASLIALAGNLYVGAWFLILSLFGNPLPLWATPLYTLAGALCFDLTNQFSQRLAPLAFGAGFLVTAGAGTLLATKVVTLDAYQLGLGLLVGLIGAAAFGLIGQGIGTLGQRLGAQKGAA